ncbi:hypothetical protein EZS27_013082 [termite gut metagenome]|uniref:Uncharacterized protein n=1 Tax=termite gut metagenome TaxID=433724 RepID=A0A5J4S0M2_9ZZZZ
MYYIIPLQDYEKLKSTGEVSGRYSRYNKLDYITESVNNDRVLIIDAVILKVDDVDMEWKNDGGYVPIMVNKKIKLHDILSVYTCEGSFFHIPANLPSNLIGSYIINRHIKYPGKSSNPKIIKIRVTRFYIDWDKTNLIHNLNQKNFWNEKEQIKIKKDWEEFSHKDVNINSPYIWRECGFMEIRDLLINGKIKPMSTKFFI